MPLLHLPETHLLSLAQTAPFPPQILVDAEQVVLSVQSVVVLQAPPTVFWKQFPPVHLPDKH